MERFAGRAIDLTGALLPSLEDWAGGREVGGWVKDREEGRTDKGELKTVN